MTKIHYLVAMAIDFFAGVAVKVTVSSNEPIFIMEQDALYFHKAPSPKSRFPLGWQ